MFVCIKCKDDVRPKQHAVTCDSCDRWQHRTITSDTCFICFFIISLIKMNDLDRDIYVCSCMSAYVRLCVFMCVYVSANVCMYAMCMYASVGDLERLWMNTCTHSGRYQR